MDRERGVEYIQRTIAKKQRRRTDETVKVSGRGLVIFSFHLFFASNVALPMAVGILV